MKPQDELQALKSHIKLTENGAIRRDGLELFCSTIEKVLLIDADSLLYNVAYVNKDKDLNLDYWYADFLAQVQSIGNRIEADGFAVMNIVYYFTACNNNFRNELLPSYKANRETTLTSTNARRLMYYCMGCLENSGVTVWYNDKLEADDGISLDAIIGSNDRIIVNKDKDLNQIEGSHFDYYKVKTGDVDEFGYDVKDYRGWSYTTKQEGYDLFLKQMLVGDVSDNIKGVKGVGKVGANKIVTGSNFEKLLKVARSYKDMERMRLNVKLMRL
mgnify:CR=1 FL=1|tara:strand:+ start:406 stop:1221 length:816 start_codon:yes stop_codon:yes gene_type:complete